MNDFGIAFWHFLASLPNAVMKVPSVFSVIVFLSVALLYFFTSKKCFYVKMAHTREGKFARKQQDKLARRTQGKVIKKK
jgi:hypothetical protein